jgi:hypothetical protein
MKNTEQISTLEKFNQMIRFSFYISKLKIQLDSHGGPKYVFGITIYPHYHQFEINLGRYLLNFWWRKDML